MSKNYQLEHARWLLHTDRYKLTYIVAIYVYPSPPWNFFCVPPSEVKGMATTGIRLEWKDTAWLWRKKVLL